MQRRGLRCVGESWYVWLSHPVGTHGWEEASRTLNWASSNSSVLTVSAPSYIFKHHVHWLRDTPYNIAVALREIYHFKTFKTTVGLHSLYNWLCCCVWLVFLWVCHMILLLCFPAITWNCTYLSFSSAQGTMMPPQRSTGLQRQRTSLHSLTRGRMSSPWLLTGTPCPPGSDEVLGEYLIFAVRKDAAWKSWYSFVRFGFHKKKDKNGWHTAHQKS